jgi:hypothetical protein
MGLLYSPYCREGVFSAITDKDHSRELEEPKAIKKAWCPFKDGKGKGVAEHQDNAGILTAYMF